MIEQTLVFVKPDGVKRGLIGEIIKRFEQRGLKIVGLKLVDVKEDMAKKHYREDIAERHGEKVRKSVIKYVTSGPVCAMVIEGIHAVTAVRKIVGSTYPGEADVGTIRGDYCHASKEYIKGDKSNGFNLVHASGSEEEAKIELALWFSVDEIHDYKRAGEEQFY